MSFFNGAYTNTILCLVLNTNQSFKSKYRKLLFNGIYKICKIFLLQPFVFLLLKSEKLKKQKGAEVGPLTSNMPANLNSSDKSNTWIQIRHCVQWLSPSAIPALWEAKAGGS